MINTNNLKFYFYNGFSQPKLLAKSLKELENNLIIESNYKGNITHDTLEEIKDHISIYDTVEDMHKYNENMINNIFIDPTIEDFQRYNLTVGLTENDYLHDLNIL